NPVAWAVREMLPPAWSDATLVWLRAEANAPRPEASAPTPNLTSPAIALRACTLAMTDANPAAVSSFVRISISTSDISVTPRLMRAPTEPVPPAEPAVSAQNLEQAALQEQRLGFAAAGARSHFHVPLTLPGTRQAHAGRRRRSPWTAPRGQAPNH